LLIIFYLINFYKKKDNQSRFIFYSLIVIILFDILILGFYFGGTQLIDRFAFLKSELNIYISENNQSLFISRGDIAKFILKELDNYLIFGYGSGNFELIFKNFYDKLGINFANHAHFDLSEFISELGLVGTLLLLIPIYKIFKKIKLKSIKNFYLVVFVILILVFDFSLHIPIIQIIVILLFSTNTKRLFS
jgi:O-antigen ligase